MDEMFNADGYMLNYDMITKSKDSLAITRLLAADLIRDGYINVGEYIENISDADLQTLIQLMEREDDQQYEDLILISEMLATGEGCDASKSLDDFSARMNQFVSLLVCESLGRKGLVKLHRENMSFHPDMAQKIIVERIDD